MIYIQKVILPDQISDNIKNILKSRKDAVFTNPDLCLELNVNGNIEYETIELKTTKTNSIPGSSVQQVSPFEWVIFIKHNENNIEIVTGQYINAINTKMQFPDRSPRPEVSFSELQQWTETYRLIKDDTIQFDSSDDNEKALLLNDWQDVLAERWINIIYSNKIKNRESWFNNNLRKFVIKFLNRYDKMIPEEKEKYKQMLNKLIK